MIKNVFLTTATMKNTFDNFPQDWLHSTICITKLNALTETLYVASEH